MDVLEVRHDLLFAKWRCGKVDRAEFEERSKIMRKQAAVFLKAQEKSGRTIRAEVNKRLMRLDWFVVFGKADLNTPVGVPPWAIGFK